MHLPKAIAALTKWTDDEQSRYPLNCVRLKRADGTVFAEATDGRRLCRLTWPCDGEPKEYGLPAKTLSKNLREVGVTPDGYSAGLNGTVTLYGQNAMTTVPHEELERWPKTEQVLYPKEGQGWWPMAVKPLRDEARAALKGKPVGLAKPALNLEICGANVKLDALYVRDMCETAIQCGFDQVHATATDKQSAVHFYAECDVKFESVIMPLAAD
jgi:hypothetical protein